MSSSGEISGALVSITETNWVRLEKLFEESMAVHVTVVSPSGKNSGASFVIEAISPLSVAVASPRSTSFCSKLVASITIFSGTCKIGNIVSKTVIFCSMLAVFPPTSVAVQVTIVSPIEKNSGASFVIETTPKMSSALGACNSTILS